MADDGNPRASEAAAVNERVERKVADRPPAEAAFGERESRLFMDSIPGMVALLTPAGDLEILNRQLLDYFGQTLDELRHWAENGTIHPEDLSHVIEVFSRSLASGSPYEIVQRFRRSDGVYRWFENRGFPLRDESGQIVRWCVLLTDIDDRKQAEEAVRKSERQFRLLVDTVPALVWRGTADGALDYLNPRAVDYLGHTTESLSNGRWLELVHPDHRDTTVQRWLHAVNTGSSYEDVYQLRRADGQFRWIQSVGQPFRDVDGRITQWYGVIVDIDDQKRTEDALRESERESRLIVDSIPGLVVALTPIGEVEFVNRQVFEYFGGTFERLQHWQTVDMAHPEDLPRIVATFAHSMATGEPFEFEVRARRFDGVYRWFQSRGFPLRDTHGQIVRWYNLLIDIDERKRAEAELRRAYNSFADAQRLSKTGSFITDLIGDNHNWSDEALRIFEFDPATKVTLQAFRDVIHPEDLPIFEAAYKRASEGLDVSLAYRIITPGGTLKHIRAVAHVTENVDGRPVFIGAIQDVTEAKAAEDALNRAGAELAHVSRVTTLSALTASIAHEVNQPLSGIITNAGTCLRMLDAVPPNIEGAAETARRTIRDGNRAAEVVARLRALFSKREFTLEPLDLNDATREVIALSANDLHRNRIVLRSELADDLPDITGDRIQLQQVILNLLRNASDAMAEVQDRPRQLLIRTLRDDSSRVRVSVRDAGVGLAAQSLETLFDAFYTTKSGGMGIGLFVSRSIIEKHQGRLWAETNADGPGATFSFSIPCQPGTLDAAP
jgi:PAS domain S-box-containing protein